MNKLYKILSNCLIIGLFAAVGLTVLMCIGNLFYTPGVLMATLIVASCSLLGINILPWTRRLEQNKYKKLDIIFIIATGILAILVSICVILLVTAFSYSNEILLVTGLKFTKATLLLLVQYAVADLIATNIIRYKKSYIPFQIIMYISNLFVDFYLTFLALCIRLDLTTGFTIASAINILITKVMITLISLAVTYVILCQIILKRIEVRKIRRLLNTSENVEEDVTKAKIKKLQDLLHDNLITEEQYNEKIKAILEQL